MSFGGFSQSLELVDFFLKRRDAVLQIGFALREGLDLAGFNLAFQVHGTELGDFTIEYTNLFARLPIQGPVGGVHHYGGVRNNVGTIVNKAIQIIALAHISEEVFLRPSRKHGRAQPRRRGFVISGKHRGLMTALGELADFAHPQPVAEPGPPLGKAYRGQLSRRQAYVGGEKLLLRPILAGIFAIGQACNASVLHLDEKIGAVTFAIKHHGKTMKQRISLIGSGAENMAKVRAEGLQIDLYSPVKKAS